jgi:uncharacterized membrane protein YccC
MNRLTPEALLEMPVGQLSERPATELFRLKQLASDLAALAKAVNDHLDRALDLRFSDRAQELRRAQGKDFGVTHFDDDGVRVTAELPKRVEWDQSQLAQIATRIRESGDDPAQYVETIYRVSETKYGAWPDAIRSAFAPARTVKPGKPGFRLALITQE